jgi:hypothetical protein
VTVDGVWIGELDLLTNCIHQLELHFTVHWHIQTSVLSLLQYPLAVSWQQIEDNGDSSAFVVMLLPAD